jgi:TrmH family RNA methyltransferase
MNPQIITSRKNENIQSAAKLVSSAEYRHEQKLFAVEGARLCRDAAISHMAVQKVFYTAQAEEKYPDFLRDILKTAMQAYMIEPHVAEVLSSTKNTQGVFCVCEMHTNTADFGSIKNAGHYIALENIQDPANLGAVLRTAEALGISGAVLAGNCCDVYSPKVLRASMGAVFRLPFLAAESMPEAVLRLNAIGFSTYAAVPVSDAVRITNVDFSKTSVVVVGNEGNGLTQDAIQACSAKVTIPMLGRAESLNAASSAAILMWEMMRG